MQNPNSSHYLKPHKPLKYKEKNEQPSTSAQLNQPQLKLKTKDESGHSHNDSMETCQSDRSRSCLSMPKGQNLKVELCKNYISKGYCPYQTRCRFAHGVEELRARDPKQSSGMYRTRRCKVFFERGECRFGQRCNFLHESRTVTQICSSSPQHLLSIMRTDFIDISVISAMDTKKKSRLLNLLQ